MTVETRRGACLAAGMLWTLIWGAPLVADDTELFVVDTSAFPESRPNVLLIVDTSGSMADEIQTQPTYTAATSYGGDCAADRVYWRDITSGPSGEPPSCTGNDNWFERSALLCDAALQAFATAGYFTDRVAQFDAAGDHRWENLQSQGKDWYTECEDDAGLHGNGVDANEVYAHDDDPGQPWTADPGDAVTWGATQTNRIYALYDGNFLNWYHYAPLVPVEKIQIVRDVSTSLLDTVNGVNVGLMRFNRNSYEAPSDPPDHGGAVIYALEDIGTARESLKSAIDGLPAEGSTPIAETMYEAARYYRGMNVLFGNLNTPQSSVPESRTPPGSDVYKTPIEFACQKNFAIYLSDGLPTRDADADSDIEALIGSSCTGNCMDEVAEYLFEEDQSAGLPGPQNVVTYTIGFTEDIPVLEQAATKGGGEYFRANNTAELTTVLSNIIMNILDRQTTFASPAVSVNSFNRTQNLNDLYITVFHPTGNVHWPGNLKKYRLRVSDSAIVDAAGQPAVDGDFFADGAQSFWTAAPDGGSVTQGGAANRIPDPSVRNVYTCLGCTTGRTALSAAGNEVSVANPLLDTVVLNINQPGDPSREDLIAFVRGVDVQNGAGARNEMGDPLHAQPVTVMYDQSLSVVYFATNDGYLHAIDTNDGRERWAFIPEEFLGDMVSLYHDGSVAQKHYGIDGSPRVQIVDPDGGAIEGDDKVYLFFGMRRGGDAYYALDVTNPDSPQFLWKKTSGDLPTGLGQTWSNPVPTRIDVAGGTYSGTNGNNEEKLALVFGAGYDAGHDLAGLPTAPDTGNGIVIVDSVNGNLLWHVTQGGGDMTGTSMGNMKYAFAADIKVVDFDGDRLADRMYAADMGGQVWRFDIHNGQNVGTLVRGGMIAQLGGAPALDPPLENTRRFYYSPDVALLRNDTHNFMHIGIGSGHRASPNSTQTRDRFYALRDHNPFAALSQADFNVREADPITDADLEDIRDDLGPTIEPGAPGWRMELRVPESSTWLGEKVLAEARTFANRLFFTTFTPGAGATANDCTPQLGTNRLYIVDLFTGAPVTNLDGQQDPNDLDYTDRYTAVGGAIANEVVFLFPSPEDPQNCVGEECMPDPIACVNLLCFPPGFENDPIRTFWSQESVD